MRHDRESHEAVGGVRKVQEEWRAGKGTQGIKFLVPLLLRGYVVMVAQRSGATVSGGCEGVMSQ